MKTSGCIRVFGLVSSSLQFNLNMDDVCICLVLTGFCLYTELREVFIMASSV